jgi:Putative zinc-finger
MTTFNLTCEAVEATLADYLDETLEPWVRESIEEHLGECARCTTLARELRNITRQAAVLPALLPEGDVWPGIAGRIGAPVVVSEPVAESAPLTPTTEPIVLASDASLAISEPHAVASQPPVLPSEPPLVTGELPPREPLAPASEPPLPSGTTPVPTTSPAYALPSRREKRWGREWMGLAAAALVLVTAGTTFLLTVRWLGPARTPNVASDTGTRRLSGERPPADLGTRGRAAGREQVASDSSTLRPPPGQLGSALTVSSTSVPPVTRSPEDVVYDKEINVLQGIVRRQKAELDTSTVAVIETNLRTLDSAIAQIRAALKKDPGSSLLDGQASRALEMKVELLRRAAMLRSNT